MGMSFWVGDGILFVQYSVALSAPRPLVNNTLLACTSCFRYKRRLHEFQKSHLTVQHALVHLLC